MNALQQTLFDKARVIFRDHGYTLDLLADGRVMVTNNGPTHRMQERFGSLCSAVDWAKPILRDDRLYPMYC